MSQPSTKWFVFTVFLILSRPLKQSATQKGGVGGQYYLIVLITISQRGYILMYHLPRVQDRCSFHNPAGPHRDDYFPTEIH